MGLLDFLKTPEPPAPVPITLVGHEPRIIIGPPPKDEARARAKLERLKLWVAQQEAQGTAHKITEAHRKQIRILEAVLS